MASLRKRYQDRVEAGPRQDDPPVTTAPTEAAKLPEAAENPKPIEQPQTESPADTAARTALRERLREMENAEALTHQAQQPQPQYAAEPQQQQQPQQPAMPAQVQKWLAEHPQYCDPNDHVAQAEIYTATLKCNRDGKSWDQPDFIPTLERYLGIAPRGNGQVQSRPIERPPAPAAPPRSEPVRQQQRSTVRSTLPHRVDQDRVWSTSPYTGLQQLRWRRYQTIWPLRQLCLPLLPSSGLRVPEKQSNRP